MRGYWHIAALSVVTSMLTVVFENYLFVIGFFLWLLYLFYSERLGKIPLLVALTLFLFFSFYIPTIDKTTNTSSEKNTQHQLFSGKIVRPITVAPTKVDFILKEESLNEKLLVIYFPNRDDVSNQDTYEEWAYGASCRIKGQIDKPSISRNPGQFDFNLYLKSQGIDHQVIVNEPQDIVCEGASFFNRFFSFRSTLIARISDSMGDESAAWLRALVLGDDSQLEDHIVELFQRWGLSHILAISGLHVGLIVGLIYFLVIKLNVVTKEKGQWVIICFLPFYAVIAGGQPSVWRASLMVLMFILLNKLKFRFSVTDVLSIIFILLIIIDRYMIYHVGFQLSFSVTFGLVLSKDLLASTKSMFFQGLLISFISQMMILPIQLAYFSFFQPLSILVNVIVVPYFSLIVIPLMFLLLIFSPILQLFLPIIDRIFSNMHNILIMFIEFVDKLVSFPIIIGNFPIVMAVLYFWVFYLCMYHLQKGKLVTSFKYGVLLTALLISLVIRPYLSPVGTVTMLDIGQGDAFIVELPYRRGVIFIDAGSGFSFTDVKPSSQVFKHIIQPYLYRQGITKIDAILISHEDIDHMGSVDFLVEEVGVDQIMMSPLYELDIKQEKRWKESGAQVTRVNAGESITIKGQTFHILGPLINKNSPNENSLVLHTELGEMDWLFTGDIDQETERELMNKYESMTVDVLKVAHHGSHTSTDRLFIEFIKPNYALISVGMNNMYGHPAQEVLETLENMGVYILRTDENGAIQFKYKDNKGTFFKYLP